MNLEFAAATFLKLEKRCRLILWERTPRTHHGQPDVLGVTASGYLMEIEIKRSLSDFRANTSKHHMQCRVCDHEDTRNIYTAKAPSFFWFLVPITLVEKVRDEIPEWAGLLCPDERNGLRSVMAAPRNKASQQLTLKECARLMNCAGNQIVALMRENCHRRCYGPPDCNVLDEVYSQPIFDKPSDYVNFQI